MEVQRFVTKIDIILKIKIGKKSLIFHLQILRLTRIFKLQN